jgi:hypothetical protein
MQVLPGFGQDCLYQIITDKTWHPCPTIKRINEEKKNKFWIA